MVNASMWRYSDVTETLFIAGMRKKSGMNHARFVQKAEKELGGDLPKRITDRSCPQVVKYVGTLR